MRILGVDPGSSATGFGLVEGTGRRLVHLDHGVLRPPADVNLAERLHFLHAGLADLIDRYRPEVAVVERVFMASNPHSALVLGQARGALLACLGASGVRAVEVAAREAKQAIAGSGAADKRQVQAMVARLLGLETRPPTDAADALALALCHAQAGVLADLPLAPRGRNRRRAMTRLVEGRLR